MAYTQIASFTGGNLWPSDWGTSGTLGIFCTRNFVADDGKSFQQGDTDSLTGEFVTTAPITVAANIPTYGTFSLPKTDLAAPTDVRYVGYIFDSSGVQRSMLFGPFDLVSSLGDSITYLAWWNDNQQRQRYPQDSTPTTTEMNTAISQAFSALARLTVTPLPTYDLSSNVLGVGIIVTVPQVTVASGKQFDAIRVDNIGRALTLSGGNISAGISSYMESSAASAANTAVYAVVANAQNYGPGVMKALHAMAGGNGTSSGILAAGNFQIQPVATTDASSANIMLTNTGVSDKASAISIIGNGARWINGVGNTVAPVAILGSFFQAWMATGSATNARAFSVLNNAGSELGYVQKDGSGSFPSIGLGGPPGAGLLILGTYSSTTNVAAQITNTNSAGITSFSMRNDLADTADFGIRGSARAAYGALVAGDAYIYGTQSVALVADNVAGKIRFLTGGNTLMMQLGETGDLTIYAQGKGLVLRDADGVGYHRITVNAAGTISAAAI